MTTISEIRSNTIKSAFTLARSLKRRPNPEEHHFPMGVERTLTVINGNDGLSSRDLGEALDIRPSSVTELVNRLQEAGLVTRKEDEADKRVSRISLTEKGKEEAEFILNRRSQFVENFSACFTEEEARQFCELADKLSAHLRSQNGEENEDSEGRKCCHRGPKGHGPHFGHGPGFGPGMHHRFCRFN